MLALRRFLLTLLGLVALQLWAPAVPAVSADSSGVPGTLDVVTYNVAGLPEGISRSRPLANLPRVGELLNRYDIALVQEDFAYPLELRRRERHPHASAPFERSGRLDFGDGLSQFSRLPFFDYRRVTWTSCHGIIDSFFDCLTPKGFTVARQSLGESAEVHLYNLHMDAGWSPDDRAARAAQVEQLIEAIERSSRAQAVIVGGDTNIYGRDAALLEHLLGRTGLRDACAETRCDERGRVDRILFRSSAELTLRARQWRIASEFVDEAGQPLSDHSAVAVRFEWQRVAAKAPPAPAAPQRAAPDR